MPRQLFVLLFFLLALTAWGSTRPTYAAPACDPQAVAAVYSSSNLDKLVALFDQASSCRAPSPRLCIGRLVAIAYTEKASAQPTLEDEEAELRKGRRYGAPWRLLIAQGDVDFARGADGEAASYTNAAKNYELAINDLAEEPACKEFGEPGPPPIAQIEHLHKRMQEAKLLAPTFELVRTRDGECGGVFLRNVKGFEPKSTPVPIEFAYNSTSFTEKGKAAAEALLECVSHRRFSKIFLSGHTDMIGGDDFNLNLSARRLDAVKAFLVKGGYAGAIQLAPMGKREPFAVDDPTQYTEDEINQMNRRVELREATQ